MMFLLAPLQFHVTVESGCGIPQLLPHSGSRFGPLRTPLHIKAPAWAIKLAALGGLNALSGQMGELLCLP